MAKDVAHEAPSEFRYWENRHKPWARALRRGMQLVFGFDPEPSDDLVQTFGSMYYDADPLAEAFVDEIYLGRGPELGRAMLDTAIEHGTAAVKDAPASLIRLFADIEVDPRWVDRDRVERGARQFRRFGTSVFHFGGALTLAGYSENSVAKPLILTGGYAGDSTRHRFLETAAFWIAVSNPGGMMHGAPGRASALRVRIMHVFVRRRLLSHPEWRLADWGVPISQADALLTLMGGSFAPGVAMRAMGYRTSDQDILDLMHFWRYVGHVMGVRPRFYPESMREGYVLSYLTALKSAHLAGEDGKSLCHSFARAFDPAPDDRSIRHRWMAGVHRGYTRFFTPPWTQRAMGLPGAGLWTLHPLARAPLIFAADTLRRRSRRVDDTVDWLARKQRDRWFAHYMGDRRAEYHPPRKFTR